MKKVEDLKAGDILLVSAKKVNGGKVQLCFAQLITNPEARPSSIAGLLNASDERFTQSGKARYAWQAGQVSEIKEHFGVDCSGLAEVGDEMEIGLMNPTINGFPLNIQITETTEGSNYDVANFETRAKRAGADGPFITDAEGKYIYVKSSVITGEPIHAFLSNTSRKPAGIAQDVNDALSS